MQFFTPYEYQKNVIDACKSSTSHSQLISMPTGTGKTITFLYLAKELNKRTLILVHREELLNQTYDKAQLLGFKKDEISLANAERKENFGLLNIAMVQTLSRNLDKYSASEIEAVIIDEAHHATAPSYLKILDHFRVLEDKKHLFGFTATPLRGDKDHLSNIFCEHTFKLTLSEATQLGYIVPVHGMRLEIDKSLKEIDTQQGDYDISQLDKVMNCDSINDLIAERCSYLSKTPGIIFCTSVDHAEKLAKRLRDRKRKAISISYKTPKKTQEQILRMLRQGRVEFITNAVKLSEGFDHPPIQTVILARPTRSPVLYKQMIGRGLRNSPSKYDCFVLEFTSNDPKMMRWENIDENSTFQSVTTTSRKSREEAKSFYRTIFHTSNVEILDVRISAFEFYECKIRRYVKYKNFFYIPFTEGFFFCEIRVCNDSSPYMRNYKSIYGTMIFWKEKYKSFYVWDTPNYCMLGEQTDQIIDKMIKNYCEANKLGKWYPSELEPIRRDQKILLSFLGKSKTDIKTARKAEFEIENLSIKKCIDKFLSKGEFSQVMSL